MKSFVLAAIIFAFELRTSVSDTYHTNHWNATCSAEVWIEILSPTPAQLFLEGSFERIELRFQVHNFKMGEDSGVANVHIIKHAMSYGGDPFRGREDLRSSPQYRIYESFSTIVLVCCPPHLCKAMILHSSY